MCSTCKAQKPNALTQENLAAFEPLAGQLATAIENARLVDELVNARAVVEAQMNQLTRQGWDDYLDGIHNREYVGYTYEAGQVTAVSKPSAIQPNQQKWHIKLQDASLGELIVESPVDAPLSPVAAELIEDVSQQVGQQIDNLRLLKQAQQYRLEAEAAVRRLTHEAWQEYQSEQKLPGFVYDGTVVSPLANGKLNETYVEKAFNLPLQINDESIGSLSLAGIDEVDEETEKLLKAVAQQLGDHIEELRLEEQTEKARTVAEQRNKELGLINRMMSSVTASLDLVQNMKIIAEEMSQALKVSHVGIALITQDENHLEVVTEYPEPTDDVIGTLLPIEGNALTLQAIETSRATIAYDAQNSPLTKPLHGLMKQRGIHMLAVVPMIVGNEFFGTVGFDHTDPNYVMSDQQLRLAETIVYQAATVVQNARLFNKTEAALAETNEQARRLARLNELSEAVARELTVEDVVSVAMDKVTDILDAKRMSLHLIDEKDETMLHVVGIAGEVADSDLGERIQIEGSPMGEALTTHQIAPGYFTHDDKTLPAFFVPLFIGAKDFGTFNLVLADEDAQLKENDRQIILQIAAILTATLENLRLFDQTRQRAEREQLLNSIVTQVAASLDLQHSLQIIVDEMATALNVDQVRVALLQPDGANLQVIAEHFDPKAPSAVGMLLPLEGNDLTQEVLKTRKLVVIEDAQNNPRTAPVHDLFREQGIETVVLLPLVVNDEVLGTIGLDILDDRVFDLDTLQLAETIVYQAAVAIQNTRLFEQSQTALAETETLYSYTSQLKHGNKFGCRG